LARRATEREVRILTAHLEASLLSEHLPELHDAVPAHRARLERNVAEHASIRRVGPFRRWDAYERALEIVEAERDRLADENEREPAGV